MRAGCTIVSPNYLPYARTLAGSYRAQHPDQAFFVLIVADLADRTPFLSEPDMTPILLQEIEVPDLRAVAMKYDILELNTNVKPTFLKYLLNTQPLDALVYLDPDIFVYKSLDPVFASISTGASAVLTPHMTQPVFDGKSPAEQDLLYNGTYNLGFIAVGSGRESRRLLDWWETRCLQLGFSEGRTGLFVDQKWINLAPGLFEGVEISRDAGLNMAYWNLHERTLVQTGEGLDVLTSDRPRTPLRFFHFSGFDAETADLISRNTDRFILQDRPDLQQVFAAYGSALKSHRGSAAERLPYGFDRFSDGTAVTRLARRLFAAHEFRFSGENESPADPFDHRASFFRFARAQGLVRGKVAPAKTTWKEFNGEDRRVTALHRLLRWTLRVLGPERYELLMRYLAHISVLRHQQVLFRDRRWPDASGTGKRS